MKTDSDIIQPQDNNLVPTNQVGHVPEVIPTPYVPARTWAENQLTRKQIEKDYPLLEDILNPIPVDFTLSGKYPDTPVNIDKLASVEVLLEFKRPGKQLVALSSGIRLSSGSLQASKVDQEKGRRIPKHQQAEGTMERRNRKKLWASDDTTLRKKGAHAQQEYQKQV